MMGLLDALNSRDGVFALGLLDAAAPRAQRTGIGAGLLSALSQAQAFQSAQDDREQRRRMQELQMQHIQAQIGETQAQAQQRQAAAEAAQRQAAEQQRIQALIRGAFAPVTGAQANAASGITGPRPEALNAVGSRPQVDYQQLIAQGVPADLVKHLAEAPNLGAPEVARTIEGRDAQGRPVTLQFDKQGRQIGQGIQQWKAPIAIDTGGQIGMLDPAMMQMLARFQKSNTPDALLNSGTQWGIAKMVDQRQRDANSIASAGNVIKSETDLRKEFADLPEVKGYKAALPAFVAVRDAATRNNPQADINLIYGLAKLYDPTSVVRDGEYATIANSQAIPEWLKGQAQRLTGGGRLTAETKAQILREAQSRIGAYQSEYEGAQQTYGNIVQQRGGSPGNVFTPVGESLRSLALPATQGGMPSLDAIEAELRRRARGVQ